MGFIPCQKARSSLRNLGSLLVQVHSQLSQWLKTDDSNYPNEEQCSGLRVESKDTLFLIPDSKNATLFGERIMPIK